MSNRVFSESFSKRQKLLTAHSVKILELLSQKLRDINVTYYISCHSIVSCFHEMFAEFRCKTKIP